MGITATDVLSSLTEYNFFTFKEGRSSLCMKYMTQSSKTWGKFWTKLSLLPQKNWLFAFPPSIFSFDFKFGVIKLKNSLRGFGRVKFGITRENGAEEWKPIVMFSVSLP